MGTDIHQDLNILVADDSRAIRELLVATLHDLGVNNVLEAADGIEALQQLGRPDVPVDVVFCDLEMPGMDGADLLRRIALAHANTSIVVFSGLEPRLLTTVADMAAGLGLEVLGVLGKPFSEAEIRSLFQRYARSRMHRERASKAELTPSEIEAALREDRIEVYYQPKVRISDGRAVGVEALARLRDPHLGILGPASFVQAAEAGKLTDALTRRVLEKALQQAAEWRQQGIALNIAVNISPGCLRQVGLTDYIAGLADQHGIPHDQLTLELTEDQVAFDPSMLHSVSRLRLKGFRLSVDDFGTGDSGLYRLKSLPFTELKIDRGFLAASGHREDLRSVLETSIDLGHRLHLSVVAEGVENWEQWRLLDSMHCDVAQGFLVAPALPGNAVADSLTQWNARLMRESTSMH